MVSDIEEKKVTTEERMLGRNPFGINGQEKLLEEVLFKWAFEK